LIRPETIETIRQTARVEEVVGDFVRLKRRGANLTGLCPFHNERTPSFSVSPSKGIFKCFGCGASGDALKFIMELEHLSYPDALRFLAQKYGIAIEEKELSPEEKEEFNERESLFAVNTFANEYFRTQLWNTEMGRAVGLSYFYERGFSDETIQLFSLGYAQDQWDGLKNAAHSEGFKESYLQELGLITSGEKKVDMYRDRVIFPIQNLSGRVVGFGARYLLEKPNSPKYINSPENPIYSKRKVLYGLYQSKKYIIKEDRCVLVEGYTDVISLHQAGVCHVVSSSGTSLTSEQIQSIRKLTHNVTILYDGDAAGIKASFRGIDMLLEEGMKVRVVLFPNGEDPDSYSRKVSSDSFKAFLKEEEQDFIRFKVSVLLKDAENDPIKRASVIRDIVSSIALVPDALERAVFVRDCAVLTEMEEETLLAELHKLRQQAHHKERRSEELSTQFQEVYPKPAPAPTQEPGVDASFFLEKSLVRLLLLHAVNQIHFPGEDTSVRVADFILDELLADELLPSVELFRSIFLEVDRLRKEEKLDEMEAYFLHHPNEETKKFCIDIFISPYQLSENWEKKYKIVPEAPEFTLRIEMIRVVYAFKLKHIQQCIVSQRIQLKEGSLSSEDELIVLAEIDRLSQLQKMLSVELTRVVLP
jgi:DNA primase